MDISNNKHSFSSLLSLSLSLSLILLLELVFFVETYWISKRQKSLEKRVKSLLEWEMKKVDLGVGRRLDSKEKGESRTYRERKKK